MDLNEVVVSGRLERPYRGRTRQGREYATALIAPARRLMEGQAEPDRDEIEVIGYGRLGETLAVLAEEGLRACVHGHLRHNSWIDGRAGTRRESTQVLAAWVGVLEDEDDIADIPLY